LGLKPYGEVDSAKQQVLQFLNELIPHNSERRSHCRIPFSRPATIYFDNEPVPIPAVIRDISMEGIGLLHDIPIALGEATLRIPNSGDKTLCARVDLTWCRGLMKHYYVSGGKFVRVYEEDPIKLDNPDALDELISELQQH
jgi:hypothetical protein